MLKKIQRLTKQRFIIRIIQETFQTDPKMAENTLASKMIGKAKRAEACKYTEDVKSSNPWPYYHEHNCSRIKDHSIHTANHSNSLVARALVSSFFFRVSRMEAWTFKSNRKSNTQ